jgi:hypothetical protein
MTELAALEIEANVGAAKAFEKRRIRKSAVLRAVECWASVADKNAAIVFAKFGAVDEETAVAFR